VDYRWCSYAAAIAGVKGARQALTFAVTGKQRVAWGKVVAEYRCLLYGTGEERQGGDNPCRQGYGGQAMAGRDRRKGGFTQEVIEEVWASRVGSCHWRRLCVAG